MKRTDRMVGIDGTAQGRMNTAARMLIHQRFCTKKPDRPSAISIFRFTATTMNTSVFTAVRKNTGSSASLT